MAEDGTDPRGMRLLGLYVGRVTRRDDPDGLGRVKVEVPGLLEPESTWAWPLGSPGGGTAQRGHWEPPAVDATVAVMFHQGEVDEPYYWTGPWGAPDGTPDIPQDAAVEGADRQVAVTEDEEWRLVRDSTSGGNRWLLEHKGSTLALHLDGGQDKLYLVREGATEALVLGTSYRQAEASHLSDIIGLLKDIGNIFKTFKVDASFLADHPALGPALDVSGVALVAAATVLEAEAMAADGTAYLSTKAFTE